ncbi:MAG: tetratricopeptide repeat protein [Candidatus Omnitrophica bacterium]|nr:tetratricopeptide repeat protein [Candidatus Omnitrophota bacterium]
MKNIIKVFFTFSLACVLMGRTSAYSATLYLKSGAEVEGTITQETNECVRIDFYGVPLRYDRNEIERIDKDAPLPAASVTADDCSKNGADLIINGLYEDAVYALAEGIKRNPADVACYHNHAVALALAGNYPAACDAFKKALELETGDYTSVINYNLAEVYCRLNLIPEAKATMGKITNENLRTLIERTVSLKMSGINADSIILASSFPPDTVFLAPQPLLGTNDILTEQRNLSESLNDRAYIVENFPLLFLYKSPLAYLNLSFTAITQGRLLDARKYLDTVQEGIGEKKEYRQTLILAGVYFARGQIALEEHDYYLARKNFKKAIEIFPRWPAFHKYLGTTYYLLRRYPKAREEFQTATLLFGRGTPEAGEIEEYLRKIEDMRQKQ